MPQGDNDNVAVPAAQMSLAELSALWHVRSYAELLRPRLNVLAGDAAGRARALARQLADCIGCRRPIRCEACAATPTIPRHETAARSTAPRRPVDR